MLALRSRRVRPPPSMVQYAQNLVVFPEDFVVQDPESLIVAPNDGDTRNYTELHPINPAARKFRAHSIVVHGWCFGDGRRDLIHVMYSHDPSTCGRAHPLGVGIMMNDPIPEAESLESKARTLMLYIWDDEKRRMVDWLLPHAVIYPFICELLWVRILSNPLNPWTPDYHHQSGTKYIRRVVETVMAIRTLEHSNMVAALPNELWFVIFEFL